MDVSLPFGLRWAVTSCQDVTGLVAKDLSKKGLHILNYIDDFEGVAISKAEATDYFTKLWETLH